MRFSPSIRVKLGVAFAAVALVAVLLNLHLFVNVLGVRGMTFEALVVTGVVMVVAILLSQLFAAVLARRINRLKQGANNIAGGNLATVIPTEPHDEIGELALAMNDMTDRLKQSYRRLTFEKQRDETLLQSMGEGLIALNDKGHVALINDVASHMLSVDPHPHLSGRLLSSVMPLKWQDGKPVSKRDFPGTVTLSENRRIDEIFIYRNEKTRRKIFINIRSNPVVLEGRVVGAIMLIRDVTKEREIDRMKTEFISLASHQLRTPLSAMKWFTEMLLNGDAGELKPEQQDFAQNIADSTERMIELVNSLLNISRIESGRIIVDPRPTDLGELVNNVVKDLSPKIEERRHSLIVSSHPKLPKISIDPHLIGQVYLNLLTNAIKYTAPGGEISVFISTKGKEVISQVTDNGYGIPEPQQGRIFQKFFRAENVSKHETDGTGLGLYLIKAIIESSGGKIWFKSKEHEGTTFWFSLPLSGMKPKEGDVTLDS